MKKYNDFKKFYVNGQWPIFLILAAIVAALALALTILNMVFFEEIGFDIPQMILALSILLPISFVFALIAFLLSISKIYVSDSEIIISYLKKENNGRYNKSELKEIFLGERLGMSHDRYHTVRFMPYMVLCFGDDTEKRRSHINEITCDKYIQLCDSNLKINAVSLEHDEKLLTEIKKNFSGKIIEGVKPERDLR